MIHGRPQTTQSINVIAPEFRQGMVLCNVGGQTIDLISGSPGTRQGSMGFSNARFPALKMTANGDRLDIPFRSYFNFSNGFTILAVVRSTGGAATDQYVINQNFDGANVPISLNVGNASVTSGCGFFNGGWRTSLITTNIVNDGKWHAIGGIGSPGVTQNQYYVDGVLDRQSTSSGAIATTNTNAISIGEYVNGANSFIGDIALVAVWNYRFQTTDIASARLMKLTSNLAAPWQIFRQVKRRQYLNSVAAAAGHSLFLPPSLSGLGAGGPFFHNRLQ